MDVGVPSNSNQHFLVSSNDVRSGFISGRTFGMKQVRYSAVDELAIFEGDIVLGTVDEMEAYAEQMQLEETVMGVAITGALYLWRDGLIPYVIDSNLPKKNRVTEAIKHWEENTLIRFVKRTKTNAAKYPNYIHFCSASGCWSSVGVRGGKQDICLHGDCGVGDVIHQIAHAVGLWHEQSREDRDLFIRFEWANVVPGTEHNFNQHIADGDDVGKYDFDSIMHHPATAFSKNGRPTIIAVGEQPIGQRRGLSDGDVAAVTAIYPGLKPREGRQTVETQQTPQEVQRAPQQDSLGRGVDDAFWLAHSKEMVKNAIPAHDKAAETLQKTLAWFWTAYSAVALIGVSLAKKQYPLWLTLVVALPGPVLILAYFFASYVPMPRMVAFKPRLAEQVREEHQRVLRYKRKMLQIALIGTLTAAILVAVAVVAVSFFGN